MCSAEVKMPGMASELIDEKLRTFAAYSLPANRTDELVPSMNGIEELQSVTELMTLMRQ